MRKHRVHERVLLGRVLGCVVAGGQSSRMGRDKASLVLEGETLLARASRALATVCSSVVVSGAVSTPPAWPPVIPDRERGRGPLGGVVTALLFAQAQSTHWVMFLPVDMPLFPTSLLPALLERWSAAAVEGACVCCAETDGIVQPLVSLIHVDAAAVLEQRLRDGDLRVRPGLEAAAEEFPAKRTRSPGSALERTIVSGDDPERMNPRGWRPSAVEWALRPHWFANANRPEDLAIVEQALHRSGPASARAGVSE